MKLQCNKCKIDLTKSLFLTKWKGRKREGWRIFEVPIGGIVNFEVTWEKRSWAINPNSLIDQSLIPKFEEGMGCCNHDWTQLYCQCDNELGVISLDCWKIYKGIYLNKKKVNRINT